MVKKCCKPDKKIEFPKNFFWGAATSAYQVEGDNKHSDWWVWEKEAGKERSGKASKHYEFFNKDFDLVKKLNHNAHRLSIEWARVEPEEGKFIQKEINHYVDVVTSLRRRKIEPIVTLHHFTNPVWFAEAGGWVDKKSVERFLKFVDVVARALSKHVRFWITVNEPMVYITHSFIIGVWPPQIKSYVKAAQVEEHLASAHIRAYRLIHSLYKELNLEKPSISIAQNVMAFVPCEHNLRNRFAAYLRDKVYNLGFIDRVMLHKSLDFIGINYYSRQLVELTKIGIGNLATDVCNKDHHPVKKNSLGWDIYPEGLYDVLLELKKYQLPIMITENGICTLDDRLRWEYLSKHLENIHRAMTKGVKITGYLYWALVDNFEWDKGFGPRFGLIHIDYNTYKRTVRESAKKFAKVCKTGVLQLDCFKRE